MKKLLLLIIKYMPIVQMLYMLVINTLVYFDIVYDNAIFTDFIFGNSLSNTIALYVASYALKFCIYHRLIITCNLINLIIIFIDCKYTIPITDFQLLVSYYIVVCIFIIIINYLKTKNK